MGLRPPEALIDDFPELIFNPDLAGWLLGSDGWSCPNDGQGVIGPLWNDDTYSAAIGRRTWQRTVGRDSSSAIVRPAFISLTKTRTTPTAWSNCRSSWVFLQISPATMPESKSRTWPTAPSWIS